MDLTREISIIYAQNAIIFARKALARLRIRASAENRVRALASVACLPASLALVSSDCCALGHFLEANGSMFGDSIISESVGKANIC